MRSFSVIAVVVAAGLLVAACGSTKKSSAPATTSSPNPSTPSNSSQGPKDNGSATAKGSEGTVEAGNATALAGRLGPAQALNSLKSALVEKGINSKQGATSGIFGGNDGTVEASAGSFKQGTTPAQSLAQLGNAIRMQLSNASKQATRPGFNAATGDAIELTSSAQLRTGILETAAFQQMSAFAAESSKLETKVAAGESTLNAKLGNAVVGTASTLSKQSLSSAKALGSLGGLSARANSKASVSNQKQAAGSATTDGSAGTVQAGSDSNLLKAAPTAAAALQGLAKTTTAHKQAASAGIDSSAGGVATGTPTRTRSQAAATEKIKP